MTLKKLLFNDFDLMLLSSLGQSCIWKLKPALYIVLCDLGTLPPPTKNIPMKPFQIGGIQIQNLNFNCACNENRLMLENTL